MHQQPSQPTYGQPQWGNQLPQYQQSSPPPNQPPKGKSSFVLLWIGIFLLVVAIVLYFYANVTKQNPIISVITPIMTILGLLFSILSFQPNILPQLRQSWKTGIVVGVVVLLFGSLGLNSFLIFIRPQIFSISPRSTPIPTATLMPTKTPTPLSLYHADWSQGIGGWKGGSQWSVSSGGILASNGSSKIVDYLKAPFQPKTANYAVEAQIQFVKETSTSDNAYFGIFVRSIIPGKQGYDGYLFSGDSSDNGDAKIRIADEPNSSRVLGFVQYPLDTSWHTYRVEVQGNTITFFIDNQNVVQVTNNQFTSPGLIGLLDGTCQINVRSFTVFSL
jgi:hypothetical protein